jgi:glucan 1,3-beta-glucosidase
MAVPYHPVPNPQEPSDTLPSFYDSSPSSPQAMSAPHTVDWNGDGATHPPTRFFGSIDGQGGRDSLVTTSTNVQSDGHSSLYALNNNQGSYSARDSPHFGNAALASPFNDDPNTPSYDAYDASAPLSTLPSEPRYLSEKQSAYANPASKSRRKRIIIIAAVVVLILIAAAIAIPVITISHHSGNSKSAAAQPSSSSTSTASSAKPSSSASPTTKGGVTGGDGSLVTLEDGTTFTYKNAFGGTWYWDPNDPFNNAAQAQSWTPALNAQFNYGIDHIRGYVT